MKIKFIKDYTLTVNNPSCTKEMVGCQPSRTIKFKLGQVVSGGVRGGSLDSKNFYIDYGNYTNPIPLEYIKVLNDDGTPYDKKTADVNSNKNTRLDSQTFLQKNKTNLLIAGVLVLAYLAYKKFKK
jgi:hypothetical protein